MAKVWRVMLVVKFDSFESAMSVKNDLDIQIERIIDDVGSYGTSPVATIEEIEES